MPKRGKIVLLHFAGQMPLAGIAWQAVHYLVGLEKLGYEAWYVEDSGANPYDPRIESVVHGLRLQRRLSCGESWSGSASASAGPIGAAIDDVYHGLSRERVRRLYGEADALINLCGAHQLRDEQCSCPVRIMIDTDPGYEQIKYAKGDPASAPISTRTRISSPMAPISAAPECPIPLVRHRLAPDPAAGRCRSVARAAGGT